jgi:Na+-driven multidrug efflux pump
MRKSAVGFIAALLWLLAGYFFIVSRIIGCDAYSEPERVLVTGLMVVSGGVGIAVIAFSLAYLKLCGEASLRQLTAREADALPAANAQ